MFRGTEKQRLILSPTDGRVIAFDRVSTPTAKSLGYANESVQYLRNGQWETGPWVAGCKRVGLVLTSLNGHPQLALQFYSDSPPPKRVIISQGDATSFVTSDGAYVMVHSPSVEPRIWKIISSSSAQQIGSVTLDDPATEMCISGSTLYFLTTTSAGVQEIKSVDIRTNRVKWVYSLGTQRAGPPPPQPK